MTVVYQWEYAVRYAVWFSLNADATLVAASASVGIRNAVIADPPAFPDDIEAADSPIVSVATLGQDSDEMIATNEWGPRVRVAVQVLVYTPMAHATAAGNLSLYVSVCAKKLRDIHGTTSAVYNPDAQRQGLVSITGITPITKHPSDICWMQQTIYATVTIIGD